MEAVLYCLQVAVKDSAKNHRKLLLGGLDVLMDIEERKVPLGKEKGEGEEGYVRDALQSASVHNMASMLVGVIGDFNYVVCAHCEKRQGVLGLNCLHCGRPLALPAVHPTHTRTRTHIRARKSGIVSTEININTSTSTNPEVNTATNSDTNTPPVVSTVTAVDTRVSTGASISAEEEEVSSKRSTRSSEKSRGGGEGGGGEGERDRGRMSGLGPTSVLSSASFSTSLPVPVASSKGGVSNQGEYPHHIYPDFLPFSGITLL